MKLCLAGLESIYKETRELTDKVPFILQSFYYVSSWQLHLIHKAELFLLDSGAFTFMNNSKNHVDWNEYLTRYINFINENDVKYFFELDIDSVVGYEEVKRLRCRLENETNKKCIPVWHKSRGIEEYKKLCSEYDYIAIGGIVTKEITKKEHSSMKKLVAYANSRGTKVHGLGFTPIHVEHYGFYSTDSTSWKSISRFGKVYEFTGKNIKMITPKNSRVNRARYVEGEIINIKEWIKYQNYLRRF